MNINHDHTKATVSEAADRIETDIESIQSYLFSLFRELTARVRQEYNPAALFKKYKIQIILGTMIISRILFPPKKKKHHHVKTHRVAVKLS